MSRQVVTSGFDAYINANQPSATNPSPARLHLRSDTFFSYLWFRNPAPRGATVTRATLVLHASGASTGSRTISVYRTTEQWFMGLLNWNNRPAVATPGRSTTVGALAANQRIEVDVTPLVQAWANGSPNYGVTVRTTGTTLHYLGGLTSGWKPSLDVEWSDAPATPTDLSPSEAVTGATHPHVTFTYLDVSGNTELAAVQVQANPTNSWSSPLFDSGTVATTEAGLDLSTTAFPGLSEGVPMLWRVRAQDGAGLWSAWSQAVAMTYEPHPTVEITNLNDGEIYDPSPVILWTASASVVKHKVIATDLVTGKNVYVSPDIAGPGGEHTIPFGPLKDGRSYRIKVRVWDGESREATPGDPTWVQDTHDVLLDVSDTVGWVTGLTATQVGVSPEVELSWQRNDTPDAFVVLRDGEIISRPDAGDVFDSGTTYRLRVGGHRPNWEHSYTVRAVVNNVMSVSSTPAVLTTRVEGAWIYGGFLGTLDGSPRVAMWGDDGGSWDQEDDASVYAPIGSTKVVRVVNGMRGLEGSFSGHIADGFGATIAEAEEVLYTIKENPTMNYRLALGDTSLIVLIGNVKISPTPRTRRGNNIRDVSFDFWSVGELPFDYVS